MLLRLGRLAIALESADAVVRDSWAALFAGWLEDGDAADVRLRLTLRPSLPPPPAAEPFFDDSALWPEGAGMLRVYSLTDGVWLRFAESALVSVPLTAPAGSTPPGISGVVAPDVFRDGRFEDVTLTSLAPALRRRGYFLLHAFAAERDGHAVLLSGPTRSGKTTTGLNLLLRGWRLLANDAVLLEARPDGVHAWPTPGHLGIRPGAFELLPGLAARLAGEARPAEWAEPARVALLLFPELAGRVASTAEPLPAAVALARALAESADRWDEAMLDAHVALLERLCRQAGSYALQLGNDMTQLGTLIEELLPA